MKRLHPASAIKQVAFEETVAELKRKVEEVVVRGTLLRCELSHKCHTCPSDALRSSGLHKLPPRGMGDGGVR